MFLSSEVVQCKAFSDFNIEQFFINFKILYYTWEIVTSSQVSNRSENYFSPGQDVVWMSRRRVITEHRACAVCHMPSQFSSISIVSRCRIVLLRSEWPLPPQFSSIEKKSRLIHRQPCQKELWRSWETPGYCFGEKTLPR